MANPLDLLLVLIPALPLTAAALVGLAGPRVLKQYSHLPVIAALLASCVCSFLLLREVHRQTVELPPTAMQLPHEGFEHITTLWTWVDVGEALRLGDTNAVDGGGWRNFRVDICLRADALTAIMLSMVTFVSTLVAIFAAGYMHGDRSYWRFFAYIGLFVFSMTMLVSVSNFVLLFVFWEAVGVCSYLLIGFWYEKPEAAAAGMKAFLVNRVGDFGFALALFLIWTTYGTLNFHDTRADGETDPVLLSQAAEAIAAGDAPQGTQSLVVSGVLGRQRIAAKDYVTGGVALAICLLLLLGACGKSAQFPLHIWLPDAMEGPTPVSALIHAATMVTAGVYMVTRCTPLFMASPTAQLIVACIGAFTALLAGLIALTQFDLKRVLAYSTISQLGYMFLALGAGTVGGISAGMFHLFTHAFFKALLFLGAGSVMHAMGHVIDMRQFSGLRRLMPFTHWTFAFGCVALAGIPPLAGFWSKDAIVASVEERAHALHHEWEARRDSASHRGGDTEVASTHPEHEETTTAEHADLFAAWSDQRLHCFALAYEWLYYSALFTAFLTAFYTFRAFFMTFYGPLRVPHEAGHHAHESPPMMTVPLIVLATCACIVGIFFDRTIWGGSNYFGEFLLGTPVLSDGAAAATRVPFEFHLSVAGLSTAIASVGVLLATYLYLGRRREVDWLRSVLDLEGMARWLDVESVARWSKVPWITALQRGAAKLHVSWLASLVGNVLLLFALVISTPLLLAQLISPYKLSFGKFYFDELYYATIVVPLRGAAQVFYVLDRWLIDGLVNAVGRIPIRFGNLMRSLQMGLVQFYALAMVLGLLVLLAARIILAAG